MFTVLNKILQHKKINILSKTAKIQQFILKWILYLSYI